MRLRPILAAALAALCAGASAQDSLVVFGIVDLAARIVDNDQKQYQLASGGDAASRLGFRGSEDLGGGLGAGFWLEAKLTPDTADSNFSFDRRATVSLTSRAAGELRLGRDRVPSYYEFLDFDPFGDGGLGASTRMSVTSGIVPAGGAYSTTSRADNLVAYFTPGSLGGLFAHLGMAAGEGQLGNKYYGARLGYRDGPLAGSASYGRTQVSAADDAVTWKVGGAYDFKVVQLTGFFYSLEIGAASQENWQLGLSAPFGAFELRGSYQAMQGKGTLSNQEAWGLAVGARYSLSKRTALYTTYSTISNTHTAFAAASGPPLTPGNDSRGLDFGLRHSF